MFFVLGAEDAVDGVGGAAAGLVIVADLHFAEQADREQVQATEQEAESGHHQRAVFGHDRDVAQEFFQTEPENNPLPQKILIMPMLPKKCSGRDR